MLQIVSEQPRKRSSNSAVLMLWSIRLEFGWKATLKKTQGAVINVASDAGPIGLRGAGVCCVSIEGVVNMTRALELDLVEDLIRHS
jgi:NAD(P)-dependent dehydrogenase (short-subunit alcohol dehydrogenase family)